MALVFSKNISSPIVSKHGCRFCVVFFSHFRGCKGRSVSEKLFHTPPGSWLLDPFFWGAPKFENKAIGIWFRFHEAHLFTVFRWDRFGAWSLDGGFIYRPWQSQKLLEMPVFGNHCLREFKLIPWSRWPCWRVSSWNQWCVNWTFITLVFKGVLFLDNCSFHGERSFFDN